MNCMERGRKASREALLAVNSETRRVAAQPMRNAAAKRAFSWWAVAGLMPRWYQREGVAVGSMLRRARIDFDEVGPKDRAADALWGMEGVLEALKSDYMY